MVLLDAVVDVVAAGHELVDDLARLGGLRAVQLVARQVDEDGDRCGTVRVGR